MTTMDDLEQHAAKHSSHLAPSDADYRQRMTSLLLDNGIPMSFNERLALYAADKIPPGISDKLDMRALHEAMARRHAIIVNW